MCIRDRYTCLRSILLTAPVAQSLLQAGTVLSADDQGHGDRVSLLHKGLRKSRRLHRRAHKVIHLRLQIDDAVEVVPRPRDAAPLDLPRVLLDRSRQESLATAGSTGFV